MYRFTFCFIIAIVFIVPAGNAQIPSSPIIISTKDVSLVFIVNEKSKLCQTYLGERLASDADYKKLPSGHEAYITSGTDNLFEPAIRAIHADGNPSLDLVYSSSNVSKVDANIIITTIVLKDPVYPFYVNLNFKTYYEENIIETWSEIKHDEKKTITLTSYASFMLHLDAAEYYLTQFHGEWLGEMKMEESKLTSGIKVIDSKLGTKTTIYQSPAFMVSLNKPSSEDEGELIAGTLAWSGNFKFSFEADEFNSLRVAAGINPFASEYSLASGKSFTTPAFIFTYSNHGKGEASRNFNRWGKNYGVLDGKEKRLTLLNNWEATYFDFDEPKLTSLVKDASYLGLDLFLLDDGWFGNKYPRSNDGSSLGDWQVTKTKLPHGLGYLVKESANNGIKFGIWIEPEMVNPKSELYEKHPDWILRLPNRREDVSRNQLVLDLVNPAVQDFIYNTLDELLSTSPGIAYIKWDCNRMMTSQYSPYLKQQQTHLYVDYARSLYRILDRFRVKYPHLPVMLCSSGGGRVDYGALKYFTEFWASDNTNPYDRVFIQWGYSYFFPSVAVCSHVTSSGNQSLKFKTDVAMSGKLGYDIVIADMTEQERQFSKNAIKEYKRISDIIWHGDLYRLLSPYESEHAVTMYADPSKTKAIIFSYNLNTRYNEPIQNILLKGLDATQQYKVQEINLFPEKNSKYNFNNKIFSGDYLMKVGLRVSSNEALSSNIIEITKQ